MRVNEVLWFTQSHTANSSGMGHKSGFFWQTSPPKFTGSRVGLGHLDEVLGDSEACGSPTTAWPATAGTAPSKSILKNSPVGQDSFGLLLGQASTNQGSEPLLEVRGRQLELSSTSASCWSHGIFSEWTLNITSLCDLWLAFQIWSEEAGNPRRDVAMTDYLTQLECSLHCEFPHSRNETFLGCLPGLVTN